MIQRGGGGAVRETRRSQSCHGKPGSSHDRCHKTRPRAHRTILLDWSFEMSCQAVCWYCLLQKPDSELLTHESHRSASGNFCESLWDETNRFFSIDVTRCSVQAADLDASNEDGRPPPDPAARAFAPERRREASSEARKRQRSRRAFALGRGQNAKPALHTADRFRSAGARGARSQANVAACAQPRNATQM